MTQNEGSSYLHLRFTIKASLRSKRVLQTMLVTENNRIKNLLWKSEKKNSMLLSKTTK